MIDLERVISAIDWLIFNKKVKNRRDLARVLEYTESSLSQILNKKVPLSDNFIKKLAIAFSDISAAWLLTGEGEMLQQADKQPQANDPTEGCACPFTESMKGILENMTAICDVNKRLVEQQSDLIAAIKELAMKR